MISFDFDDALKFGFKNGDEVVVDVADETRSNRSGLRHLPGVPFEPKRILEVLYHKKQVKSIEVRGKFSLWFRSSPRLSRQELLVYCSWSQTTTMNRAFAMRTVRIQSCTLVLGAHRRASLKVAGV